MNKKVSEHMQEKGNSSTRNYKLDAFVSAPPFIEQNKNTRQQNS